MSQPSSFDFNIPPTSRKTPSTSKPRKLATLSPVDTVLFWGACLCLAMLPLWFDWGARYTMSNVLLSALGVAQYALLPGVVLWRLVHGKPLSHGIRLAALSTIALMFILILVTWLATGYARFASWADWLELLVRFGAASILVWYDRFLLRTVPPLGVLAVFGFVMLLSIVFRVWDVSTLTAADWKAHWFLNGRSAISVLEKLLVTAVVLGFAASRKE